MNESDEVRVREIVREEIAKLRVGPVELTPADIKELDKELAPMNGDGDPNT